MKQDDLERRMANRIARKRGDVFLRADFRDMGSYHQVGRALGVLVRKGRLIRIGHGLYARTTISILNGKLMLANGLGTLKEALHRLGVETVPTRFDEAYNSGRSEQVPTGRMVGIRGKRVRRKIGYDGIFLKYERAESDREKKRNSAKRRIVVPMSPITVREALRLFWDAERYPMRGNEDRHHVIALDEEARERAAVAIPSPDDPPEFGVWLTELMDRKILENRHDEIMDALYKLFDPSYDDEDEAISTPHLS
jgi:hypothetical protein